VCFFLTTLLAKHPLVSTLEPKKKKTKTKTKQTTTHHPASGKDQMLGLNNGLRSFRNAVGWVASVGSGRGGPAPTTTTLRNQHPPHLLLLLRHFSEAAKKKTLKPFVVKKGKFFDIYGKKLQNMQTKRKKRRQIQEEKIVEERQMETTYIKLKPRRIASSFGLFVAQNYSKYMDKDAKERVRALARDWKQLPADEKQVGEDFPFFFFFLSFFFPHNIAEIAFSFGC
jgi:hypothetical protein